jgi:hypothetical protein
MRFTRAIIIAGCAVLAGLLSAGGSVATAATAPRSALTQFACQKALDPADRSVSVQAVMRPLTGTRKLAVKFDLIERAPGTLTATVLHATGLGVWIAPDNPTLGQLPGDVWRLDKSVLNLDAPATYQFRATFRWTGLRGKVLGTAVKYTQTCRQRELRPDLLVQSIAVAPIAGHPQKDLYTAVIADQGLTGAGPFEVLFAPGNTSPPIARTVQSIHAGESKQMTFVGPACDSTDPPTVTVDATSVVDDYDRANNVMAAVCPSAGTS